MGKFLSKATIASMIFSAMLSPYANAEVATYDKELERAGSDVLAYTSVTDAPEYITEGKVFVDSFSQPGLYSIVKNESNISQDLTVVLGEDSVGYADNTDDTMYLRPVKEDDGTWTQYFESNSHWVQDLLESEDFQQYENISWVGKNDAADFISGVVAYHPDRINSVTLVDGGVYAYEKLTQASYDQLLNMEVSIQGSDSKIKEDVAQSYLDRGFQQVHVS